MGAHAILLGFDQAAHMLLLFFLYIFSPFFLSPFLATLCRHCSLPIVQCFREVAKITVLHIQESITTKGGYTYCLVPEKTCYRALLMPVSVGHGARCETQTSASLAGLSHSQGHRCREGVPLHLGVVLKGS